MKTMPQSFSYVLFSAALVLLLGAAPPLPEELSSGKFLVLRNGRTMEGDIERLGEQYRVRRNGGETMVPAASVLRLFHDTEHAYLFLRGKSNLTDPDERLRLAKWCFDYRLNAQALEEAKEADRLRPKHRETQLLLARIQQPPVLPAPVAVQPVQPMPEQPSPAPAVDLTGEALGQFTQKVQPILLNACASCHTGERGGSFKLMKTTEVPSLNRKVLQENLASVLAQVNHAQPQASPLLTKAVSIHGGGEQAPLRGRQAIAYRALEDWVRLTLANNPQLQERLAVPAAPPAPATPETKSVFAESKAEAPVAVETPQSKGTPVEGVSDPFDPGEFNRQAHPEREKPAPPSP